MFECSWALKWSHVHECCTRVLFLKVFELILKITGFCRHRREEQEYDCLLKLEMSSVLYVHTQRFVAEIQCFCRQFSQLQSVVNSLHSAAAGIVVSLYGNVEVSALTSSCRDWKAVLNITGASRTDATHKTPPRAPCWLPCHTASSEFLLPRDPGGGPRQAVCEQQFL